LQLHCAAVPLQLTVPQQVTPEAGWSGQLAGVVAPSVTGGNVAESWIGGGWDASSIGVAASGIVPPDDDTPPDEAPSIAATVVASGTDVVLAAPESSLPKRRSGTPSQPTRPGSPATQADVSVYARYPESRARMALSLARVGAECPQ
jgi:hypothetical protein